LTETARFGPAVWDAHGHYLPESVVPLLSSGHLSVVAQEGEGGHGLVINGVLAGTTTESLSEAELILDSMDRAGLDRRVLSPPPFAFRYGEDATETRDVARRINEATAEIVRAHPERFAGLCTLPLQDPPLAVEEMGKALGDLGLAGVSVGTNIGGRLLSDPSLRPFFHEVEERGVPVLVHPEFVPSARYADYYLINVIGMPVETGTTIANIILSGLLEEHPGLRLCFVHGGGIAPYLLGRWSHTWRVRDDISRDTTLPPEKQLGNLFWDSLTHSPEALGFLVRLMGAGNVVVGTDAPFDVADPTPLETLAAAPWLSEADRLEIACRAPLRWLQGGDRF